MSEQQTPEVTAEQAAAAGQTAAPAVGQAATAASATATAAMAGSRKHTILWLLALVLALAVGVVLGFSVSSMRAAPNAQQPGLVAAAPGAPEQHGGESTLQQPDNHDGANGTTSAAENTAAEQSGNETTEQKNARLKAKQYLEYQAFSYHGLIAQLEYEGFSTADAIYGVEQLAVDWKQQAAKKAAEYLEFQAFSRQGLLDQLLYEKFTLEEAEYGVKQNGY